MTRHRSPRSRGAAHDEQDRRHGTTGRHQRGPDTRPVDVSATARRGAARHRSPAGSAVRRGALAAGITGSALAVAGASLPLAGTDAPDPSASLALSSQTSDAAAQTSDSAVSSAASGSGAAVTPAAPTTAGPSGAVAADLIKAVDRERRDAEEQAAEARAEAERAEEAARAEAEAQRAASLDCGVTDTYDGVADSVQQVGNAMECIYPGHDVIGVASRSNASDHPSGYALDFMTYDGDEMAECLASNADALGVSYVIWDQRINSGSGWSRMEDRGSDTANHVDHVHISFERGASPDVSALRGCGGGGSDERA